MNSTKVCEVVELRQYALRPGRRDELIELFERELYETQEAVGISLIGQFYDLADPDRFVWLRAYRDLPARAEALAAFYGGPVWKAHRDAANATMLDSDNVLILRPAREFSGFRVEGTAPVEAAAPGEPIAVTIHYFAQPPGDDIVETFERALAATGTPPLAYFVTRDEPNNFPLHPVRENEPALLWFSRKAHAAARRAVDDALATRQLRSETLGLSPTPRSRLR